MEPHPLQGIVEPHPLQGIVEPHPLQGIVEPHLLVILLVLRLHGAKAKGCVGAHLILSDWRYIGEKWFDGDYKTPYDTESWELAGAKMVQVDGEKIKADTYYRCVDGEVVEAEE